MEGAFAPWHIILIAVIFVALFGAKRLPDSARSLGQALRIFKAETRGLRSDGQHPDTPTSPPPATPSPTQSGRFDPHTGAPLLTPQTPETGGNGSART